MLSINKHINFNYCNCNIITMYNGSVTQRSEYVLERNNFADFD